jgi:nicotinic acid mononucleotide adenylyltransferase
MTVAAKKVASTAAVNAFIEQPKKVRMAGKKHVISLSIGADALQKVDAWSDAQGISRAAAISIAINRLVDQL